MRTERSIALCDWTACGEVISAADADGLAYVRAVEMRWELRVVQHRAWAEFLKPAIRQSGAPVELCERHAVEANRLSEQADAP
jgi:hypothetical protein